ncbi:mitochondrial escape protein 2 [Serendipita sp. 398]|nr:mitochondrial escape protein 2 [Serendipita sp. 398]
MAGDKLPEDFQKVEREGVMFVDSIFPIRLGVWDLRHYIAASQQLRVMSSLQDTLDRITLPGFQVEKLEPRQDCICSRPNPYLQFTTFYRIKDGGAFVKFKYMQVSSKDTEEPPLDTPSLEAELKKQIRSLGGIRTWIGNHAGDVWLVRGRPWKEDMRRYASNDMKVFFEGPDIYQETLYDIMRHYGQISNISNPGPVPAGTLRFSTIKFANPRAATRAHNCIHGFTLVDQPAIPGQSTEVKPTRLATVYERKLKGQAIWDWFTSHPRISVPILVFLLGSLSYMIFDPIRTLAVQAKVVGWLDFQEFRIVKWFRRNTIDRIRFFRKKELDAEPPTSVDNEALWKDRKEAENTLRGYLSETPSTIAFVHGPQGSGKSSMLNRALRHADRKVLVIDCEVLNKSRSDSDVINGLATQTGYWPVFTWLNNATGLIDLASVGLIGQKTGLSSSVEQQQKEILEVVGNALKGVSYRYREIQRTKEVRKTLATQTEAKLKETMEKIQEGVYHDARIDAVAGTGVTSELGIGDERMTEKDVYRSNKPPKAVEKAIVKVEEAITSGKEKVQQQFDSTSQPEKENESEANKDGKLGAIGSIQGAVQGVVKEGKQGAEKLWSGAKDQLGLSPSPQQQPSHPVPEYPQKAEVADEIKALPVVVIKNYSTKHTFTDELVVVLAEWAAGLADGGLAHVVVMSDNRDNGRRLEKGKTFLEVAFDVS